MSLSFSVKTGIFLAREGYKLYQDFEYVQRKVAYYNKHQSLPKGKIKKPKIHTATWFAGAGALGGLIEGGAIGVAGFGGAVGLPLWLAGAGAGLAVYGAYKIGQSLLSEDKPKKRSYQRSYRSKK